MKAPTAVVEATQWEKDKWARWRSSEEWATDAAKKLHHSHWTGHQVNNHTCTSLYTGDKENLLLQDNKRSSQRNPDRTYVKDQSQTSQCMCHPTPGNPGSTTASLMPAPYIPDICWKLEEDTTCMRLDSLQLLVACVWLDSNESWTCGYGVVVFARWTVSTETGVTWGALTFGMIRIY